jgi:hypothetical protein
VLWRRRLCSIKRRDHQPFEHHARNDEAGECGRLFRSGRRIDERRRSGRRMQRVYHVMRWSCNVSHTVISVYCTGSLHPDGLNWV